MKKYRWFEVFGLIDKDDEEYGTETKEWFESLKEAQDYLKVHKDEEWSIDEYENDGDGGESKKIQTIY
jgi:hypothetical protein